MYKLTFGLVAVLLAGCGSSGGDAGSKPAGSGAPSGGAASGNGSTAVVELTPLPLKITVAKGGMGAMDMSIGDSKSVTVDIGGGASLNVSEGDKDFAAVKKSYEGDTILFPFKKWAKQDATMAIAQFENSGKTGFIGMTMKDVGGKKYVCKTTGLDGVASAELAEKHLKTCDTLAAK